jgi:hypothetical protein
MIVIDLFFYTVYKFLTCKFHRSKEDAKHSALSNLCVYFPFFIEILACIIGLFRNNNISQLFVYKPFLHYVIMATLSYIVFRIRYYIFVNVEQIEQKISELSDIKKKILTNLVRILFVAIPISLYVFFRLYKFGHV